MPEGLRQRIKQQKAFQSKAQEAMLNLIVAAVHVREQIQRVCKQYGLTQAHYNVLRILRGAPEGGHPRSAIIERMLDPAPDVTRLIDTLVRKGLVVRERSEVDRRMVMHVITAHGEALLETMQDDITAIHAAFDSRIPEADLDDLSRICEHIYSEAQAD